MINVSNANDNYDNDCNYTDADGDSRFNYKSVKKGSMLLVLENSFGATYKDRFTICLLNNKRVYINSRGLNAAFHHFSDWNNCFEVLNT